MIKDRISSGGGQDGSHVKEVNIPWPKIFLGIAVVATIVGALFATKTLISVEKNIAEAKEEARPANIKLTKITVSNCNDCFNIETAVSLLKKQNVSVVEEKVIAYDSDEGNVLTKKLGISRTPTYVLTGEVNKKNIEGFVKGNGEIKDDSFIFTKVTPIFIDPQDKKEVGRVAVTYITDPSCSQCIDLKLTVDAYKKAGVKITNEIEIPWNSSDGKQLVKTYKITKVPTFLFSADIDYYEAVKSNWSRIGTVEQDKIYVARNLFLPYRDLEKGQILGLVDVIYLADSSCSDCYKPETLQKNILTQGFGVGLSSERTVDISSGEGKGLVAKYKITKVPTIFLSAEADQYVQLKNVWKSVGTVESDGWYVFREMQRLGDIIYKDLDKNEVIKPVQPSSDNSQQ